MKNLSIEGCSSALFSSWYFLEQFGVLFDCGDGCVSKLLGRSRKIRHCFISHVDRDHLGGLFQFLQLNSRPDLKIYYPKDCGSFPAMADFLTRFDPHLPSPAWIPISASDSIEVKSNIFVQPFRNEHVETENRTKSLSFHLISTKKKLLPELKNLSGSEIASIREQKGEEAVTSLEKTTLLTYGGDCPVEFDGRYDQSEVLIHESTFLRKDELNQGERKRNLHSSLDSVMQMVSNLPNLKHLVLTHFSTRYKEPEIKAATEKEIARNQIQIPVSIFYPGQYYSVQINL